MSDNEFFKNYDFSQFGKNGLPLKYPREFFYNNYEKFYLHNKILLPEKNINEILCKIIVEFPEFTEQIGKQQHKTHKYSTDIHTLKVLQCCMKHPHYNEISEKGKFVLKIAVLLHDTGKNEFVITPGHAAKSFEIAQKALYRFRFDEITKSRILKIIKNHHWFESYNKGIISAYEAFKTFGNFEDFLIASVMAKSDFSNINETFHLEITGCKTNAEFDDYFDSRINKCVKSVLNKSQQKPVNF